ncbi:MAG TPA: phage tail protein [Actinocrinis sp.]
MSIQAFTPVASAPVFLISAPSLVIAGPGNLSIKNLAFQELAGIRSEINVEQYITAGGQGIVHTKQFGLTKPPTVTLKRGVDKDLSLWFWHKMALDGNPAARSDVTLEMFGPGLIGDAKPLFTYTLTMAWCSKINISGAKAGEGYVTEDVEIACDTIVYGDG